ncbi:glycosyltransferase family 2 protein [Candidatus Shapirobacteria bacterium]|nr:glycosyltransferase family 2 protein [Candidatus Shapirobacteria bacterium]
MDFSIVIPNWNGEKLLRKNLPKVLAAHANEVVVVDDGSTDGSTEFLKKISPKEAKLRILGLKKNYGFVYACNLGMKEARSEAVVLLNNDVIPQEDFLRYISSHFQDPNLFAVSLHEPNWSWAKIEWKRGFFDHSPGIKSRVAHVSGWASGGSAVFRKSIWEKLGGFDQIYHPFYWEDIDLSYRAWKRGYKIIWEPKAIVHHEHEQTVSRFSPDYVRRISERNQLLFIWKNISDPKMILEHKFFLGRRLMFYPGYWRPFLAALAKFPQVLPRWLRERKEKKVADREIFVEFT